MIELIVVVDDFRDMRESVWIELTQIVADFQSPSFDEIMGQAKTDMKKRLRYNLQDRGIVLKQKGWVSLMGALKVWVKADQPPLVDEEKLSELAKIIEKPKNNIPDDANNEELPSPESRHDVWGPSRTQCPQREASV